MVRLITHNMLASNVKARASVVLAAADAEPEPCCAQDVVNGYPLRIEAQQLETREVEFNAGASCGVRCVADRQGAELSGGTDFLKHIYPKLDWAVLRAAAVSLVERLLRTSTRTQQLASPRAGVAGPGGLA